MNAKTSLRLLQKVIGLVLCLYGIQLVFAQVDTPSRTHAFEMLMPLGVLEALGGLVFLVAVRAGGVLLLVSIAAAAIFHVLHAELSGLGALAIYAAGVLAVVNNLKQSERPDLERRE